MIKKLALAATLVGAVYDKHGYLAIVLGIQLVFVIARFIIERPKTKMEKAIIIIEWLLFSLAYVLMFLVLVTGITAFLCMAIIFVMIVLLVSDLMDVYLNSQSQYAELKDGSPSSIQ